VTRDEVAKEFEQLLVEQFSVPREAITPDAHVFDDLGLDSIDLLSAVAVVESQHRIAIPNEDLPQMLVVGACIDKLTERITAS
jgi:acyl carrier protein